MVLLGTVKLDCTTEKEHKENLLFSVTIKTDVPILGSKADMNLVNACVPAPAKATRSSMTKEEIKHNYKDVFTGVGQYEKRKDQNIIADIDKPTEWVSNPVMVEQKSGALRLCLDPRPLNAAIKRERHVIPTPADVQAQLSGKNVFTVVDMKDGYWHIKLNDESSYICTFNTPWGMKRFFRMPFGISSASEIMLKRNKETFGDIQGVHVIADDLITAATDDQKHDIILNRVLQRARDK